jgi:hypothetical protein
MISNLTPYSGSKKFKATYVKDVKIYILSFLDTLLGTLDCQFLRIKRYIQYVF